MGGRQISLPRYDYSPFPCVFFRIPAKPSYRGKLLGGSSGINGLAWGRGASAEYDSWNSFAADAGWTWADLLPFMKKAETFSLQPANPYPGITPQQAAQVQAGLPAVQGFTGPVTVSSNPSVLGSI